MDSSAMAQTSKATTTMGEIGVAGPCRPRGPALGVPEDDAAGAGESDRHHERGAENEKPDQPGLRAFIGRIEHQELADEARERRKADGGERREEKQSAENRGLADRVARYERIASLYSPCRYQVHDQKERGAGQRAVDEIVERRRQAIDVEKADGDEQRAHGRDDVEGSEVEQGAACEEADGADEERRKRGGQDPRHGDACERAGIGTEDRAVDANDRVGADFGHDGEQRGDRRRRGGIGAGQPPMQRHEGRLDGEDQEQAAGRRCAAAPRFRRRPAAPCTARSAMLSVPVTP